MPAEAQSRPQRNLAGWWISIDDTFKALWENGTIVPVEELLIIDDQGRFENRVMGFWPVDHEACRQGYACSDAPLVATGRFVVGASARSASLALSIEEHRATATRLVSPRDDAAIRSAVVSSRQQWRIARIDPTQSFLSIYRDSLSYRRTFVRVDADRLRRLRAGLMAAEVSAARHWRCWLAAATNSVFSVLALPQELRFADPLSPPVDAFVRIASYLQTAAVRAARPLPDDADPEARKRAATAVEETMVESFDGLHLPKTVQERRASAAIARYLRLRGQGQSADAAKAAVARNLPIPDVGAIPEDEIAALRLMLADSAEAKRLFCKP
jgi:hypothetical protein